MIIEGKNPVKEAVLSDTTIEKLMINKANNDSITNSIIEAAREKNIRISFVDKFLLDKLSQTGKHQGILAFSTEYKYFTIEDILENAKQNNRQPFIIILDEVEDPHNLGSIIRRCCQCNEWNAAEGERAPVGQCVGSEREPAADRSCKDVSG
jgi:23S rRNA (guanosine2251-2'-O)-methyltransferase